MYFAWLQKSQVQQKEKNSVYNIDDVKGANEKASFTVRNMVSKLSSWLMNQWRTTILLAFKLISQN